MLKILLSSQPDFLALRNNPIGNNNIPINNPSIKLNIISNILLIFKWGCLNSNQRSPDYSSGGLTKLTYSPVNKRCKASNLLTPLVKRSKESNLSTSFSALPVIYALIMAL